MIQTVLWRAKRKPRLTLERVSRFHGEVRIQPNAIAENNTEKFANAGKYAICCKREEKIWPPET